MLICIRVECSRRALRKRVEAGILGIIRPLLRLHALVLVDAASHVIAAEHSRIRQLLWKGMFEFFMHVHYYMAGVTVQKGPIFHTQA